MQNYSKQFVYTTLFCFQPKFNIFTVPVKPTSIIANHSKHRISKIPGSRVGMKK